MTDAEPMSRSGPEPSVFRPVLPDPGALLPPDRSEQQPDEQQSDEQQPEPSEQQPAAPRRGSNAAWSSWTSRTSWTSLATMASVVVTATLAVVVPLRATSTFVTQFTRLAAFCLVFAGLWLLTHRMGLLSVGHGALTGVGAYAALHAVNDYSVPLLAMPLAGIAAGCAVGLLLGIPALRLPKAFLALLTLSAAVAFPIVLRQLDGPLPVLLDGEFIAPAWTGIAANDEHIWEFWVVAAWVAVAFWLLRGVLGGPIGRALVATRDEPTAAAAFGVPVYRLRLAGVSLSGGLAGLAGALMLVPVNFNDQSLYPEELSIKLFALTVAFGSTAIGGGRLIMTLPAATVLVLLPVWLADRPGWVTQGGWIGLVKSEFFLYAVLLLAAAYARSRRVQAARSFSA
ncbi:branched-chain amino acid ABC transporter permease [Candidatus Poriferisodalis sp.]|uniref:branched-chain amino acid ABC transporter permease n=1 Tax=Candidatus Poriferisodalis sp. TaxID=3101277 RepID=UPI003B02E80F